MRKENKVPQPNYSISSDRNTTEQPTMVGVEALRRDRRLTLEFSVKEASTVKGHGDEDYLKSERMQINTRKKLQMVLVD